MAMQLTASRPARAALHGIGAVIAGFLTIGVLSTAADHVFHASGVFPPYGQTMSDGLFALALGYRVLFGVLAGYVTARLAPHHPLAHALALGVVGTLLSIAGAVAMWEMGPAWYSIAVILICLPTAWLGATLHSRRAA